MAHVTGKEISCRPDTIPELMDAFVDKAYQGDREFLIEDLNSNFGRLAEWEVGFDCGTLRASEAGIKKCFWSVPANKVKLYAITLDKLAQYDVKNYLRAVVANSSHVETCQIGTNVNHRAYKYVYNGPIVLKATGKHGSDPVDQKFIATEIFYLIPSTKEFGNLHLDGFIEKVSFRLRGL